MEIILGTIIGVLIAILVVATETYLYQQRGGVIKTLQQKTEQINPVQGMIIEPFNEKRNALEENLKEKSITGEVIRDEDLFI